jgi:hypothetical protein
MNVWRRLDLLIGAPAKQHVLRVRTSGKSDGVSREAPAPTKTTSCSARCASISASGKSTSRIHIRRRGYIGAPTLSECRLGASYAPAQIVMCLAATRTLVTVTLFPEPPKPRIRPLGRVEPAVHWFTESTRPEAQMSRETVNRWYEELDDADGGFAQRLRSELDVDHYQTLDELFVHHLLRSRHQDVLYEEAGEGPDFRVYEGGVLIAAVEVLSLFQRADWEQQQRRHARLADELDKRLPPTAGYFVDFEIESADKEPAPRRFSDFVARRIAELPPPEELPVPQDLRWWPHLPSAVYAGDGCRIVIRFIPMRPGAAARADPDARIVGTGPVIGGMVNSDLRLRERLVAKAGGRYDVTGTPFLVVASVHDFLCSDHEVLDALYGGEAVVVGTGELVRRRDGFFGTDRQGVGRNTRVSAVCVISAFTPWKPDDADVAVLENPYAALPWSRSVLPARRWFGPAEEDSQSIRFGWERIEGKAPS